MTGSAATASPSDPVRVVGSQHEELARNGAERLPSQDGLSAKLEGGEYEWRQHVPIALGVDVTQSKVDAVERLELAGSVFDKAEAALLAFGR